MLKRIQIIPKDVSYPEAIVLDKDYRELYQEADRKTAEKFGKNSLAYKTITDEIDIKNVTGSHFFWNTNLGEYLPENQRVILLEDMEKINDLDENFFKEFFAYSSQIGLRTEIPSYKGDCRENYTLKNLVKQIKEEKYEFSSENPIIISNLELVKDRNSKNEYGLLLKIGKDTKIQNDKRFALSNSEKLINFGEKTKKIYTKKDGFFSVYLDYIGELYSWFNFVSLGNDGRVVVFKDKII